MAWRVHARGARRQAGTMNRTEEAYAFHLGLRQRTQEIEWFGFEAMKFRLADNTFYTPDFMVMFADGTIEAHEVKGTTTRTRKSGEKYKAAYYQDDARVKAKVAAQMFPVKFKMVFLDGGNWAEEIM
jgi:hypothetical protein